MARIRVAQETQWTEPLKSLLVGAGHTVADERPDVEFVDATYALEGDRDVLTLVVAGSAEQVPLAIERAKAGAYAFIRFPFVADELTLLLERALDHQALAHENHMLHDRLGASESADPVAVARNLAGKPLADIEKQVILSTLEQFKGHRVRTATALGIGVRTLGMKLKRWREEGEPIIGRMSRQVHVNS